MKVKAKKGLIYRGMVYRAGEVFEVDELGYAFTWLTEKDFVEVLGADSSPKGKPPDDDLLLSKPPAELPPLDETPKKGKKNA